MHRVGPGTLRDGQQFVDVEIGVGRGGATQRERLVSESDEQGHRIRVGVDRNRCDTGIPGGTDHPDGDLTSVRDQDFRDGHGAHPFDTVHLLGSVVRSSPVGAGSGKP